MKLNKLIDSLIQVIKENGPELLTAFGVVGVGTTAFYAAKAGFQTAQCMESESPYLTLKDKVKHTWPLYMPAVVSGTGTVACIIFSSKGNTKRTAAAVTAYSVTEKAFSEYRDKMVNELSRAKDQKALDSIAQDHVLAHPAPTSGLIVLGRDEVLCCEMYTMRYFRSSMETLKKAINETNSWIISNRRATLNDFYNEIGIPATDVSAHLGWDDGELMDLTFSAVLTDDERPCLAFRYNYVKPMK